MSTPKGYSTQEKDDRLSAQFQTIEPVRELQYGSTVVSHQFVYEVGTDAAEAGSTAYSIVASAHAALKGDVILLTSGSLSGREIKVWEVATNLITLAETLPSAIATGVTFKILRHKYPSVDATGAVNVNAVIVEEALAADGGALPAQLKVVAGYDGAAVQVLKTDAAGELQVDVLSSALPSGAATSAVQTDGTQKTQIVDGSGNVISSTSNALDVNLKSPITVDVSLSQANDSVAVFGTDGTTNRALKTDASGELQIDVLSSALPSGASTSAIQTDGSQKSQIVDGAGDVADVVLLSTNLQGTDKGLVTNTIIHGETTGGGGGYVDVKVTPSGAMTTESTLAGLDAAVLGQDTMANSLPVVIASDQTAIKVTDGSGNAVATETTLAAIKTAVELLDNAISGNELQVDVVTSALPAGAATESTLASVEADTSSLAGCVSGTEVQVDIVAALPSGTNNIGDVDVASIVASTGRSAVTRARHVYSSTPVTTATYQQLVASLPSVVNEIEIFDSSGETLVIATGAISSEVDQVYVFPGGNGRIPLAIASGARVSVKAVSATASAGEIAINFYS